ncbi:MAG: ribosome small subunit-dependent GTPase A [Flavobacteriales bacterium]|nr:ribosome small subunit-dependent GTPase A [Flavobacteriales bacterium]
MQVGIVIKSTGSWYQVMDLSGKIYSCRAKGKIRMTEIRTTNPIAVGDKVDFEEDDNGQSVISAIHDRKNYIIRKSVNLSKEAQIVASNIDLALLLITLKSPDTSTGFIDRFLATAEAYSIKSVLVFNKSDQYNAAEKEIVRELMDLYEKIGYGVLSISAHTGEGMKELQDIIKDKVCMVGGHSGTGKSTLVNQLIPGLNVRTALVSDYHQKGMHTTTFAEMHPLPMGGFIIDTPGIKGFGLVDIPKDELHHYFVEFFELLPQCKFHNCMHINEPGCAVLKALDENKIAPSRYKSYLGMYGDEGAAYR